MSDVWEQKKAYDTEMEFYSHGRCGRRWIMSLPEARATGIVRMGNRGEAAAGGYLDTEGPVSRGVLLDLFL